MLRIASGPESYQPSANHSRQKPVAAYDLAGTPGPGRRSRTRIRALARCRLCCRRSAQGGLAPVESRPDENCTQKTETVHLIDSARLDPATFTPPSPAPSVAG